MGYGISDAEDIDVETAQSTTLLKLQGEDIKAISEEVRNLMDEFGDFLK
jgi:hypothetical protein